MFVPEAFPIALLMMVTSMICWGSWANTYKLTKGYRFELFYWDYAIGIFLISLVLALTLGSMGSTPEGFLLNVRRADPSNVAYAMVGGVIFNVANLLLVAGIELVGLAVAFSRGDRHRARSRRRPQLRGSADRRSVAARTGSLPRHRGRHHGWPGVREGERPASGRSAEGPHSMSRVGASDGIVCAPGDEGAHGRAPAGSVQHRGVLHSRRLALVLQS